MLPSNLFFILLSYALILPFSPFMCSYNISSLLNSPESIFYSPSFLPEVPEITVTYCRPYGLSELNFASIAFSYKKAGLGFMNFGNEEINEKILAMGFSWGFAKFRLGGSFLLNLWQYEIVKSETPGIRFSLSGNSHYFSYGFSLFSWLNSYEPLFSFMLIFREELGYSYLDIHMEKSEPPCISFSQCFNFLPLIDLTMGISQNPRSIYFGVRTRGYIRIGYSFRENGELGDTHSIGVEYTFGQNYNTSTIQEKGGKF